jgi:thioredoxin-like negative regulator of GroEL
VNRLVNDEYRGDVYVRSVNIDVPANQPMVDTYGVAATPTIFILDDNGDVVTQYRGLTDAASLRRGIELALSSSAAN